MPLRVLFNMSVASGKKTGIGHYASELLRCLRGSGFQSCEQNAQDRNPLPRNQAGTDRFDEFPRSWLRWCQTRANQLRPFLERRSSSANRSSRSSLKNLVMGGLRRAGQSVLTAHLASICRHTKFDLYHEPNYIPLPCDLPTIATVHDLSILLHPEWHPADRVAHFERNFEKALQQCVHFLTISEFGRQELIRTFNLPPECVTRTYLGVRPGLTELPPEQVKPVLARLGLPTQYLLYLGTIEPRKNLLTLLKAYCALPDSLRGRWPLLLVGGLGWKAETVLEFLHTEARHRGVIHLGYAPDEFLGVLYNGARALVFPSYYEGFGLPPVEMMACGGAVLASTGGALVETVGHRAHLIAPEDVDGWRQAMRLVVEDDGWWHSLRQGTRELARPFTWERCAADTLKIYRTVCGEDQVLPSQISSPKAA